MRRAASNWCSVDLSAYSHGNIRWPCSFDLQWLDAATLDLLEDLLARPDVQHLMLIGAYRDNEVNSAHPLTRKLEAIRQAGAIVKEIIVAPLAREDLGRLIPDPLHPEPERTPPL